MVDVTPRTEIVGAHQQGVTVATGARLKGRRRMSLLRSPLALALGVLCLAIATDWIPAKSSLGALKSKAVASFTALSYDSSLPFCCPSAPVSTLLALLGGLTWSLHTTAS